MEVTVAAETVADRILREVILDHLATTLTSDLGQYISARDAGRLEEALHKAGTDLLTRHAATVSAWTVSHTLRMLDGALASTTFLWSQKRMETLTHYINPALSRFRDAVGGGERQVPEEMLREMRRLHLEVLAPEVDQKTSSEMHANADSLAAFSYHVLGWHKLT